MIRRGGAVLCSLVLAKGAGAGSDYHLPDLANDISSVSRVTAAVSLADKLAKDPTNRESIVMELLNMRTTMSELENSGIVGLNSELGSVVGAVKKECGGVGGCGNETVLNQATTLFAGVNVTMLVEAEKASGGQAMTQMVELTKHFKKMSSEKVSALKDRLSSTPNITMADNQFLFHVKDLQEEIEEVVVAIDAFDKVLDSAKASNVGNLEGDIQTSLAPKNAMASFPAIQANLNVFKTEYRKVNVTQQALSASLTKSSLSTVSKKRHVLRWLSSGHGLTVEKKLTHGFPNGLKDIHLLPKDLNGTLVKLMIGGEQNVEELKTMMVPFTELGSKVTVVQQVFDSAKIPSGIHKSVDAFVVLFQEASSEVSGSFARAVEALQPFQECVDTLDIGKPFNFHDVEGSQQKAQVLEQSKSDFLTAFKSTLPSGLKDKINHVQGLLKDGDSAKKLKNLQNYNDMTTLISDLGAFQTTLETAASHEFVEHVTYIAKHVPKIGSLIGNFNTTKIKECSQIGKGLEPVKLKQDALLKFNASNTDVVALRSWSKSLKAPMNAMKLVVANGKSKKAAGTPKDLGKIWDISRSLADGSEKIRVMAVGFESLADLRTFKEHYETFVTDLQGIADPKLKADALKISDQLKVFVIGLPASLENFDANLPKTRLMITDLKKSVGDIINFDIIGIDPVLLGNVFKAVNNPQGSAPLLQMVSYRKPRSPPVADPLSAIQSLFDGIFNIQRDPVTTSTMALNTMITTEEVVAGGIGTGGLVAAIGGPLAVISGLGGGGLLYYFKVYKPKKEAEKRRRAEQDKEDEEKGRNTKIHEIPDDVTPEQRKKIVDAVKKSKCPERPVQQIRVDRQPSEPELRKYTSSDGQEIISIERDSQSTKGLTTVPVYEKDGKTVAVVPNIPPPPVVDRTTLNPKNREYLQKADDVWNADKMARGTPVLYFLPEEYDPKEIRKLFHSARVHISTEEFKLKDNGVKYSFTIGANPTEETPKGSKFVPPAYWAQDAPQNLHGTTDPSSKTANSKAKDPSRKGTSVEDTQPSSRAPAAGDVKTKGCGMRIPSLITTDPLKDCAIVLSDKKYVRVLNVNHVKAFNAQLEAVEKAGGSMQAKAFSLKEILESATHDVYVPPEDYKLYVVDETEPPRHEAAGEVGPAQSRENLRTAHSIAEDEGKAEEKTKASDFLSDEDYHLGPIPDKCKTEKSKFRWIKAQTNRVISPKGHFNADLLIAIFLNPFIRNKEHFCSDLPNPWTSGFFMDETLITAVIDLTICVLKQEPAIIHVDGKVCVIGDLHGHITDVISYVYGRTKQYPDMDQQFLFLGDYIDRGAQSLYVILFLFVHKIKAPHHFHLVRGNHEDEKTFNRYGFLEELCSMFKDGIASRILKKFQEAFSYMPMVAIANGKIMSFHGGISKPLLEKDGLKYIQKDGEKRGGKFEIVQFALKWGDPKHMLHPHGYDREVWAPSTRVQQTKDTENLLLNANWPVYERMMKINGIVLIIRAHEPVDNGFFYTFGNRQLLTIFSSTNTRDVRNENARGKNASAVFNAYPDGSYHIDTTENPSTEYLQGEKSCKTLVEYPTKGRRIRR